MSHQLSFWYEVDEFVSSTSKMLNRTSVIGMQTAGQNFYDGYGSGKCN